MARRTALVTGGAGFIGSALARALLAEGWSVRIVDNLLTGFIENVPSEADFFEADIRDLAALRAASNGADVIFHVAAARSVPRSIDQPVLSAETNVVGTLNVLIAAEENDVARVINSSSSSIYGGDIDGPTRESAPADPGSPYAASKASGENYCRVWTKLKGLSTVSLRYFNVFGPGQPRESQYAAVFPAFIDALSSGRAGEIHWDGEQSRTFTYVDDVVRANLLAAAAGDAVGGRTVNIAGAESHSVNDVYRSIADALGTWVEPVYLPKRTGDIRATWGDISLARELLGWAPEAEWRAAVGRTVDAFVRRSVAVD